jgi:hypothetical protein
MKINKSIGLTKFNGRNPSCHLLSLSSQSLLLVAINLVQQRQMTKIDVKQMTDIDQKPSYFFR